MDTNRVALRIVEETENGVIPSNPKFMELRNTGTPGFGYNPTTIVSDEIRPDRQVQDMVSVGAEPGGEINMELSYGAYDMLFEGAFQKRWKEGKTITYPDIVDIETGNVINVSSSDGFNVGDLILLSGMNNKANNKLCTIETIASTSITVKETLVEDSTTPTDAKIKRVGFSGTAGDIKIVVSDAEKAIQTTVLDMSKLGLEAGMWIKLGDSLSSDCSFSTAANNGVVRIESVAANKVVLGSAPKGFASDEGTGKTIHVFVGDFLKNADKVINPEVVDPILSYTVEQAFLDHKPIDYQYFSYLLVDTMSFNLSSSSFITMSTSLVGATAQISETRLSGATDELAPSNPVLNTSSNVAQIARGNAKIEGANYVNELTVEINNSARRRTAVGVYGASSIGVGEFAVTGTMSTYFSNADLLKDLINNNETSLNFMLKDNYNHAYMFDMPRVKYSSGNPDVGGKNEDVMLSLDYQAIRHPDLGYTLSITKFDYVS